MPRITEVAWEGKHSTLRIRRPIPGVVVLVLTGSDVGEHGEEPFNELKKDVAEGPFDLFIDARSTRAATTDVSSQWADWLSRNRTAFRSIEMLTGSPFIQLTARFVRDFASLGELMRIYTDGMAFDQSLARRCQR